MKMKSKKIYVRVSDKRYEFLVNKSKVAYTLWQHSVKVGMAGYSEKFNRFFYTI